MFCGILLVLVPLLSSVARSGGAASQQGPDGHCYAGMPCWPSDDVWIKWANTLSGEILLPTSPKYANFTIMTNTRVTRYPYVVAMVETVGDVLKTVQFANEHHIRLSVRSSGHDYIGRSTSDSCIQINLYRMKGLNIQLNSTRHPDGIVMAQSGNSWIRVYEEVIRLLMVCVTLYC